MRMFLYYIMLKTLCVSILISSNLVTLSNAGLVSIRGFKDLGIVTDKEYSGMDLAVMAADNTQQCARLCWLYSNCSIVTFYSTDLRCRLTNESPSNLNLSLIQNDEAITIDMRSAAVDKPRLHGCDHRLCAFDELCVPVVDPDSYKCLGLGFKKCSSAPPSISNSALTMDGLSSFVYACADGYVISGSNDVTSCDQETGQWSSIDVTCTFTECGVPPSVDGASLIGNDTSYNARVVYTCFDGHTHNSSSMSITCQASGQWTASPDGCGLVTCPEPTNVVNGTVRVLGRIVVNAPPDVAELNLDTAYGGSALHSCDEGFQSPTSPNFRSQCQSDGSWESTSGFTCNPVDCGRPPAIANTWSSFNSTTFQSKVAYMCVEGYDNGTNSTVELTCVANGTWLGYEVTCQKVDCGTPPEEKNAVAVYDVTTFLSEVNYSCNEATYMYPSPVQTRSCRPDGQWSDEPVDCISCGKPKDFPHAVYNISSLVEDYYIARYTCDRGYALAGGDNDHVGVMCLPDSLEWMEKPVVCEMVSCGNPPEIDNATAITTSGTPVDSVAIYVCHEGFALHAQANTTSLLCGPDGKWDGNSSKIQCVQASCGPPPNVINSFHRIVSESDKNDTFHFNDAVQYYCEDGFLLIGDSDIKRCLADGAWDETLIRCERVDCKSEPMSVPNATWDVEKTESGVRAVYACVEGYRLKNESNNFVACKGGNWTDLHENISCLVVDCGPPPNVEGSAKNFNGTMYKDEAVYTFASGQLLWTSVCQQNGMWSLRNDTNVAPPSGQNRSCDKPPDFMHATILVTGEDLSSKLPTTTPGSIPVPFEPEISSQSSNLGSPSEYSGLGASTTSKVDNGGIDQSIDGIGDTLSTSSVSLNRSLNPGDVITYQCDEGHQTVDLKSTVVYECSGEGQWQVAANVSPDIPRDEVVDEDGERTAGSPCLPVDCGQPPNIADGRVMANVTTYGGRVTYECEAGMKLADSSVNTRTCQATGQWSDENVTCVQEGCGPPPVIPAAQITGQISINDSDVAVYKCVTGFQLSSPDIDLLYICNGGMWTNGVQGETCLPIDCGIPPSIPYSTPNYSGTTFGSITTYICKDSYVPLGSGTKACLEQGAWEGDDSFHCSNYSKQACEQPGGLSHGDLVMNGDLGVGTVVSYSCHNGYELQENKSQMTCMHDYTWSNENIACLKLDCGDVPVVSNADYVLQLINDVLQATYSCIGGYVISDGDRILTCPDGRKRQWTGVELVCVIDPCFDPPPVKHATSNLKDTGSYVSYVCDEGYEHWWFDSRSCSSNGTWSGERVQCNITDCGDPPDFPNAIKSVGNTTYMSDAVYTCEQGFRPTTSNSKKTCISDGKWSDGLIECVHQLLSCAEPPKEPHSTVVHGSLVAWVPKATYVCDIGYTRHFNTYEKSCTLFIWHNAVKRFKCDPVTCLSPPKVSNATVTLRATYTYRSRITYDCNESYQMAGPGSKVCQANGMWSPDVTECFNNTVVFCPEPPYIDSSVVTVSSYIGQAAYTCIPGYVGGGVIRCQEGEWEGTDQIICRPLDCGSPAEYPNSTMTVYQTTYGKRAVYECTNQTENSRPILSVCNALGKWSITTNPCQKENTSSLEFPCPHPFPEIGNSTSKIVDYNDVFYIVHTCNPGYITSILQSTFCTFCVSGQWSTNTEFYVCLPIGECSNIPTIENANHGNAKKGILDDLSEVFFDVTYRCRGGYRWNQVNVSISNETVRVRCIPPNGWEPLPVCDVIDCGPFPASNDSSNPYGAEKGINATSTYLSEVQVSCQRPFRGRSNISVCQENGTWSSVHMNCEEFYCNAPSPFLHGNLVPAVMPYVPDPSHNASSWIVKCDENHQYLGTQDPVTCQLDTDTFLEEWAGYNTSFCVLSKWLQPRIPFETQLHLDKTSYFNKISVCFEGIYTGVARERPFNVFMSFNDNPLEPPSFKNFQARISLNDYNDLVVLEHKLNADVSLVKVVEKPYSIFKQKDPLVSMCAVIHIHNSTFIATVDGELLGKFVFSNPPIGMETLNWARGVAIDQNVLLKNVTIEYDTIKKVISESTSIGGSAPSNWYRPVED